MFADIFFFIILAILVLAAIAIILLIFHYGPVCCRLVPDLPERVHPGEGDVALRQNPTQQQQPQGDDREEESNVDEGEEPQAAPIQPLNEDRRRDTPAGSAIEVWGPEDRGPRMVRGVVALLQHVSALRNGVSEMCTAATCPTMSYSGVPKLPWVDEKGKKHAYSAAQYMDSALTQCEQRCDDAVLFPTKPGQPFPAHFPQSVAAPTRLLWQCIGHLYERHWDHLESHNLVARAVLEHLARFSLEFGLLDAVEQKIVEDVVGVARQPILEGTVPTPGV